MSTMASQITSVSIVYTTVCSGTDQRKHQSSASLAFVRGIHWWLVNSPHKGPVTWEMFPFGKCFPFPCVYIYVCVCVYIQLGIWRDIGWVLGSTHKWIIDMVIHRHPIVPWCHRVPDPICLTLFMSIVGARLVYMYGPTLVEILVEC